MTIEGITDFDVHAFQWETDPPDTPYDFVYTVTAQMPHLGTITIKELPENGQYSLKAMQVWSEPVSKPDHEFVCFEPIVTSEDGLNRPKDRLNIAPRSKQAIVLQLIAQPLE